MKRKAYLSLLPEDSLDYQKTFLESCAKSGIDAQAIDPDLAKNYGAFCKSRFSGRCCCARWFY